MFKTITLSAELKVSLVLDRTYGLEFKHSCLSNYIMHIWFKTGLFRLTFN